MFFKSDGLYCDQYIVFATVIILFFLSRPETQDQDPIENLLFHKTPVTDELFTKILALPLQ